MACRPARLLGLQPWGAHADRRHRSDNTLIAQSGMQMPSYRARASASAWPCGVGGNRRNGSLLDLLSLRPRSPGSPRPALHILLLPLARPSAAEDVLLEGGEAAWAVDCGPWLVQCPWAADASETRRRGPVSMEEWIVEALTWHFPRVSG